ncbi:MAG: nucleic acid binding OB-fold tRNA/helicase-type [Acidimicrobiales bacterium]|nr:nucleic acid binding OB-fold tRNA/helicase-type [Acidimicrobiales bacterium]
MTLTQPGGSVASGGPVAEPAPDPGAAPGTATLDAPRPLPPGPGIDVPETSGYRFKRRVLGPALHTDQLEHERLGKPTALAVFASDALSSTAYATEEIVRTLVPVIGVLAFSAYVVPITGALVAVLVILMFSYRQTIKAYPSAGGAYIVTKDNLGLLPAQVAGVALLTDYILTVAVSTSAGVAAMYSAFPAMYPYRVPVAVGFIAVIAWGNLRGVKESGRMFAVPTYMFLVSMFALIGLGAFKMIAGTLHKAPLPAHHIDIAKGPLGAVGIFLVLRAFASGGAAMTGVEAISNGVPAFKKPEWKNARSTLMVMGTCLGIMFIGISVLAAKLHTVPSPKVTVISQIARATLGGGGLGHALFFFVQGATMLILVLAANTSFADFPRLASFHADDAFMPKQLTKRGHRLVFSNGIIALACTSAVLVVMFGADVTHLIPLYAIGVFTSFTLSQAGMAKRHLRLKEPGWKTGILINGGGSLATGVVTIVIGVTKFMHGAWFIIVLVPVLVALLVRLNRQYESESVELEHDAKNAMTAPVLRRHSVLVLVENLDQSSARAIQYARALLPDELRAVHIAVDPDRADKLAQEWERLELMRVPLDIVDCPDRRIDRALLDAVADDVADGRTEVSVLIPRREYTRFWHRLLHDHTADQIAKTVSRLPHCNVTFVPYHLGSTTVSDDERRAYHQAAHHG